MNSCELLATKISILHSIVQLHNELDNHRQEIVKFCKLKNCNFNFLDLFEMFELCNNIKSLQFFCQLKNLVYIDYVFASIIHPTIEILEQESIFKTFGRKANNLEICHHKIRHIDQLLKMKILKIN